MGGLCLQISHGRLQLEDEDARSKMSVASLHNGEAPFLYSRGAGAQAVHTSAGRGSVSTYSGADLIESFLCLQSAPGKTVEP